MSETGLIFKQDHKLNDRYKYNGDDNQHINKFQNVTPFICYRYVSRQDKILRNLTSSLLTNSMISKSLLNETKTSQM